MRTAAMLLGLTLFGASFAEPRLCQETPASPGTHVRDTYFSIHNVRPAHALTRGAGTRVGILDHSFHVDAHPELYAGGKSFRSGEERGGPGRQSHHGYWMALTLRDIAPATEIYALDIYSSDEREQVEAMVRAIDWAILHDLDAITYPNRALSRDARIILDPALERAVAAGITVVFTHDPHPENLLPGRMGPQKRGDGREPDLNIFQPDCTLTFAEGSLAYVNEDTDGRQGYRPFLSTDATGPVTAGFIALLRSVDPDLTPADLKRILMESSHPATVAGFEGLRVPDIFEAVRRVWAAGDSR